MKTLIHILLLISFFVPIHGLIAQQVYQAHHYGEPGDVYLYNRFAPGILNDEVNQTGADVTWNLSTQTGLNIHANQILEPGEAINQFNFLTICGLSGLSTFDCFEVWNNTDQAVQLGDSLLLLDFVLEDLQRFQAIDENLLLENFIGFTVDLGGTPTQAVIVYQVPDTIMHFPVNYGDAWSSSTHYGLDLNPAGQNVLYSSTQTRITTIDGWGTLQTPYDTFENVIRLRSEILRLDTIVQDGTDTITLVADQIEYMWLDTNFSLPVMTANGLITPNDSVILTAVEYVYESICPSPTWVVDAGSTVFYVDSSGTAVIDFNILNNNADTYSWNFGDGHFTESTGGISHTYNSPGSYTVVVEGCMTDCLPLNSCSVQVLNLEIVDSTTSLVHIEGKTRGINIYPNPAVEILNLFIPAELGNYHFSIVDMTGREIKAGVIYTGFNTIDTEELTNGMYTLQFKSLSEPNTTLVYSRFMIMKE